MTARQDSLSSDVVTIADYADKSFVTSAATTLLMVHRTGFQVSFECASSAFNSQMQLVGRKR